MTADGSYDLPGQGLVRACARIQDAKPEKSVSGTENPTGGKHSQNPVAPAGHQAQDTSLLDYPRPSGRGAFQGAA